jgi:hypothetical protein
LGASGIDVPFVAPQTPGPDPVFPAEQFAVPDALEHVQIHCPLPVSVTVLGVPEPQSPITGALDVELPFAEPHVPAEALPTGAEQLAVDPPVHCHVHVPPLLVTVVGFPPAHKRLGSEGVVTVATPFAAPHWPFVYNPWSLQGVLFPEALQQFQFQ